MIQHTPSPATKREGTILLKHTLRRYRLPIILFGVLITVLTWVLVVFAESKNYDANDDGYIDNNEIVEAARG